MKPAELFYWQFTHPPEKKEVLLQMCLPEFSAVNNIIVLIMNLYYMKYLFRKLRKSKLMTVVMHV